MILTNRVGSLWLRMESIPKAKAGVLVEREKPRLKPWLTLSRSKSNGK